MVYNIVTSNHKGFIDIETEKGKGTLFHIFLPKASEMIHTEIEENIEILNGNETILIIEDDKPICKMAERALKNYQGR